MENHLQAKKHIKIFGRLIFVTFLISILCRILFREVYTRENHNYATTIFLGLAILHFVLKLIYNREQMVSNVKSGTFDVMKVIKKHLPENRDYWTCVITLVL